MFTPWFMGRPASGKSTLASRLEDQLVQLDYPVENLDGDDIRKHLHPDLGFSREDRRTNNRRSPTSRNCSTAETSPSSSA